MANDTVHVIIPAAGYGKRVGSPAAKELLPDPVLGEPMILWSLRLCWQNGWLPVVISRQDKEGLNRYLQDLAQPLKILKISPSREWPDTVLQSSHSWAAKNLLLLPDTRFAPTSILPALVDALDENDLVWATFMQKTLDSWGVVGRDRDGYFHCEKPRTIPNELQSALAWGVIGFRQSAGRATFKALLDSTLSHQWFRLPFRETCLPLEHFRDLTRDV